MASVFLLWEFGRTVMSFSKETRRRALGKLLSLAEIFPFCIEW